ncbi:MAG: HEPN domain-containing protein [Candidatus Cloacimonetes bacterium]|nr:HEPN domain-containing protein [Candidatus Cloacimonadota bacterium]
MNKNEANRWFERAQKDIEDAELLLKESRTVENVALLIQQAIEKYLKGFLIYHDCELEKIHDLITLINYASKIDISFEEFVPSLRMITNFYFESRYPIAYEPEYTKEEIRKSLKEAKKLIALVKEKVK